MRRLMSVKALRQTWKDNKDESPALSKLSASNHMFLTSYQFPRTKRDSNNFFKTLHILMHTRASCVAKIDLSQRPFYDGRKAR